MKVITICGSYRFKKEMIDIAEKLTLEGNCVLMPNELSRSNKDDYSQEEALMIDKMHKEKIKLSDDILVVNVDGYIGNSTKNKSLNKDIIYYMDVLKDL